VGRNERSAYADPVRYSSVPTEQLEDPWADLEPDAKRARLLAAAQQVFAEQGLDAPMPAIARAAGAGVGSLYRQFASKDDLVAALAEGYLARLRVKLEAALEEDDAWAALERLLWTVLGDSAADDVAAKALHLAADHGVAEVSAGREGVRSLLDRLVSRAREQGTMRADATRLDVSLVINAARAVRRLEPDAWRRMVELALDGLRAR